MPPPALGGRRRGQPAVRGDAREQRRAELLERAREAISRADEGATRRRHVRLAVIAAAVAGATHLLAPGGLVWSAAVCGVGPLASKLRPPRPDYEHTAVHWQRSTVSKRLEWTADVVGFVTTFGVGPAAFGRLLRMVKPLWMEKHAAAHRTPSPCRPDARYHLATALVWLHETGRTHIALEDRLGLRDSTISRVVHEMLDFLIVSLKDHHAASIKWPSQARRQKYAAVIADYAGGALPGGVRVIGYLDGTRKVTRNSYKPSNFFVQNHLYNAYKKTTSTNSILVGGPDGRFFYVMGNMPGSWHDNGHCMTTPHGGLGVTVASKMDEGEVLIADSGFIGELGISDVIKARLVTVPKNCDNENLPQGRHGMSSSLIKRYRQPAEWQMADLGRSVPRLRAPLPFDAARREQMLHVALLFHNFRTYYSGRNETRSAIWDQYHAENTGVRDEIALDDDSFV